MAGEDFSAVCGTPVTETETQFLLHLVRTAASMGIAELRYKDLFIRFHRAEGAASMREASASRGPREASVANASWPPGPTTSSHFGSSIFIPDMSK